MFDKGPQVGVERPDGKVWNGYEFVTAARYCEQRAQGHTYNGVVFPPLLACAGILTPTKGEGVIGETSYELHIEAGTQDALAESIMLSVLGGVIGEDVKRGGLLETPKRAVKAWREWTSGYGKDPGEILKVFDDGAEGCDEMVVVHGIPVYSHCEHHLAPIFGEATIAYIPNGKIVGLSKLPRLVDIFARRLQVQERLTNQVADAIMQHLEPKGCGVVVKARHMCMESRGINRPGTSTTTSALRGVFKDDPSARAEFLSLAHGAKK